MTCAFGFIDLNGLACPLAHLLIAASALLTRAEEPARRRNRYDYRAVFAIGSQMEEKRAGITSGMRQSAHLGVWRESWRAFPAHKPADHSTLLDGSKQNALQVRYRTHTLTHTHNTHNTHNTHTHTHTHTHIACAFVHRQMCEYPRQPTCIAARRASYLPLKSSSTSEQPTVDAAQR